MSLPIHPEHLRRYRDIAWLLWKHGRADWVRDAGLDKAVDDEFKEGEGPESLADDLESLGPTFVKVGQLLASRADLLPAAYLKALARLQDDVEPIPFEQVEAILSTELDARASRAFSELDSTPLAAGSLAQVHPATLRDGREVVVKVQRPEVDEKLRVDFEAFAAIARLLSGTSYGRRFRVEELVAEFRRTIEDEADYRLEASNLLMLGRNLEEYEHLCVPAPILEFSTRRVLTMERIHGRSVADISPLVFTELDGEALAEELFTAYLKQVLVDGVFHADPHPGNVLLMPDGRIGLIDLGMVGRLDEELQRNLLSLLIAVSEGRGREAGDIAVRMGTCGPDTDREEFVRHVSDLVLRHRDATVGNIETGRLVLEIQQVAGDAGVRLDRALALVGKTLMNLDHIARTLAPQFDPNAAIRRKTLGLVKRRAMEQLSLGNVLKTSLEMSEFTAQLPRRLNQLLTQISDSGIRLDADVFDETTFVSGFQKVANRITSGLILAAMIIGAALLMRIETQFTLLGYPGLAMLLFLAAMVGGVMLLYDMYATDRRDRK